MWPRPGRPRPRRERWTKPGRSSRRSTRSATSGERRRRGPGRRLRLASLEGHYLGPLEEAAGRMPEAVAAYRTGFEAQRALGDRGYSATIAGDFAHTLIELGDLDEAEWYAHFALEGSAE